MDLCDVEGCQTPAVDHVMTPQTESTHGACATHRYANPWPAFLHPYTNDCHDHRCSYATVNWAWYRRSG